MEVFILDYKQEVKRLISENYEPADLISKEFQMSTSKLLQNLKIILPHNAINEYLVYESLIELGYEPKEEEPLKFFWYFKRK
ncbi:hypothetical protein AB9T89_10495 [Flavobacterium oncorhynchi]|uniref:hypothetical protein n=1 Tax=Flavobacterium oncorhynchi TaxID=728056 RepID=UPI00351A46AF